jgi:acetyltransferase-like isoleucine patch superfamily enzyme
VKSFIKNYIRQKTLRTGKWASIYRRFVAQSSQEWGEYMAKWGGLNSCGENVVINIGCNITDPYLVRIGNNVALSACTLLGHDAVVRVVNTALSLKLDAVGPIEIRDNSFVGHGAIVMPNVCIGPNAVVAAGSVVTKDVPPGVVVGGVPAKYICTFDEMVDRLKARSASYPWIDLIEKRVGAYDPELEPRLRAMRVEHFYPNKQASA